MIRFGLVGGGPGAFIGPVHRIAAELDREFHLVAGAFSSDPERSLAAGRSYGIDVARAYPSVAAMIDAEAGRPDGIRMIAVATPNYLHLPAARLALEAGIAVMSDKPATATLAEARELARIVERTGTPYALTYTYTGYPMVREARARVRSGALGPVRKVIVEYLQGWLAKPIEHEGNRQASWRVDPARAGQGGCIGDIGVHAFQLAEFVAGTVAAINPTLDAVVSGRRLDDDCTVLLRFAGGAGGILSASQVATGERNALSLRVYCEKGAVAWRHETADRLEIAEADGSSRTLWAGGPGSGPDATAATRLPAGHPEGYLEAFANLYRDFARRMEGGDAPLLPGIADGVRSMAFVAAAVEGNGRGWTDIGERAA